jgi:hypothetical protein
VEVESTVVDGVTPGSSAIVRDALHVDGIKPRPTLFNVTIYCSAGPSDGYSRCK